MPAGGQTIENTMAMQRARDCDYITSAIKHYLTIIEDDDSPSETICIRKNSLRRFLACVEDRLQRDSLDLRDMKEALTVCSTREYNRIQKKDK